mmetsp:Transcript_24248/g.31577  ORF Transcript_24248/g.31577 Transcript_24248/m.31577 type:complete len:106 (+) Transcript_24248:1232-1549(+)
MVELGLVFYVLLVNQMLEVKMETNVKRKKQRMKKKHHLGSFLQKNKEKDLLGGRKNKQLWKNSDMFNKLFLFTCLLKKSSRIHKNTKYVPLSNKSTPLLFLALSL